MIDMKKELSSKINDLEYNTELKKQVTAIKQIASLSESRKKIGYVPKTWEYNVKNTIKYISQVIINENNLEGVNVNANDVAKALLSYRIKGDLLQSIKDVMTYSFRIDDKNDKEKLINVFYDKYNDFVTRQTEIVLLDQEEELQGEYVQKTEFTSNTYETGIQQLLQKEYKDTIRELISFKKELILNDKWEEIEEIEVKENELREEIIHNLITREQDVRKLSGHIDMFMYAVNSSSEKVNISDFAKNLCQRLEQFDIYTDKKGAFREQEVKLEGLKLIPEENKNIKYRFEDLQNELNYIYNNEGNMENQEYISRNLKITSEWIRIQPFTDGNKRTARMFLNMMMVRRDLPLVCIPVNEKETYNINLDAAFEDNGVTYDLENCIGLENYISKKILTAAEEMVEIDVKDEKVEYTEEVMAI